jgi:hypothetical protein
MTGTDYFVDSGAETAGTRDFSLLQSVQIISGVHPALYSVGTGAPSLG